MQNNNTESLALAKAVAEEKRASEELELAGVAARAAADEFAAKKAEKEKAVAFSKESSMLVAASALRNAGLFGSNRTNVPVHSDTASAANLSSRNKAGG